MRSPQQLQRVLYANLLLVDTDVPQTTIEILTSNSQSTVSQLASCSGQNQQAR